MTGGLTSHVVVHRPGGFTLDARFDIPPAKTVALLGPNGSGKSTAVAALAGLEPVDAGSIELAGRVLDDPASGRFIGPAERNVGVVFQDYLLFPHLTALENVAFGLRGRGVTRRAANRRAMVWLGRFGIGALAELEPFRLSGGQAQRVALARALATEPDLLLLDEPLAALDATTRPDTRRTLADELAKFAGPRLLITHDPTEAFLLADEIHIIEDGAITQVGVADDIRLRPRTPYAADLAGSNLIVGTASEGVVHADGHDLQVADSTVAGEVIATIHPRAISLHRRKPEGSPRNTWSTAVSDLELHGDRVRVRLAEPLPLTAEITPGGLAALALSDGSTVWVSIKATEIAVEVR